MVQVVVLASVATNVIVWNGRSKVFTLAFVLAAVLSYIGSLFGIGFGLIDATLVAEVGGLVNSETTPTNPSTSVSPPYLRQSEVVVFWRDVTGYHCQEITMKRSHL